MSCDLSVIIPVRDDPVRLERCLAALSRQDFDGEFEVIIVDNGSVVPPDVRTFPRARLVVEPRGGSYGARNAGIENARGQLLAFTDADCLPRPDWLTRGRAHLSSAKRGIVAGRVDLFPADPRRPTGPELWDMQNAFPQRRYVEERRFGVTANLFVDADTVRLLHGFDDRLKSNGDRDFGRRAYEAGIPLIYADDVVVVHPCRRTYNEISTKLRRLIAGDVEYRVIHDAGGWTWSQWLRGAIPPLRSELRKMRAIRGFGDRFRYFGTALFVHYLAFGERARWRVAKRQQR